MPDTMETASPDSRERAAFGQIDAVAVRNTAGAVVRPALFVALAFLAGAYGGWGLMRQRYRSQDVLVAVNGSVLTREQLFRRMQAMAGAPVLRQLAQEELIVQYARDRDLPPSAKDVQMQMRAAKRQPDYPQGMSDEDLRRSIVVSLSRAAVVNAGQKATEAEAYRYYRQNSDPKNPLARYYTPETAVLGVVVAGTRSQADRALRTLENETEWNAALRTMRREGTANGGVLEVQRGRSRLRQVSGLEDAIFAVPVGRQVGPLRFGREWWILRSFDKRPALTRRFEDVKEECRINAQLTKTSRDRLREIEQGYREFRQRARIEALWPAYREALRTL